MDNKKIEIPFGAKDSELCGWEYTIPEGMEAVVEGGKVIVRRQESEDERIRKALVALVEWAECFSESGITQEVAKPILAWLEKQKEQKPAEWSEEDEHNLNSVINLVHNTTDGAWGSAIGERIENWLKSLRSQPQGTYKQIVHNIYEMLKDKDFTEITPGHRVLLLNDIRVKCKNADECAAILDEPSWKPSEEQPSEDLEAEIEIEWDSFNKKLAEYDDGESEDVVWLNWNNFDEIARHFYELGRNTKKQ